MMKKKSENKTCLNIKWKLVMITKLWNSDEKDDSKIKYIKVFKLCYNTLIFEVSYIIINYDQHFFFAILSKCKYVVICWIKYNKAFHYHTAKMFCICEIFLWVIFFFLSLCDLLLYHLKNTLKCFVIEQLVSK